MSLLPFAIIIAVLALAALAAVRLGRRRRRGVPALDPDGWISPAEQDTWYEITGQLEYPAHRRAS